MVFDICKQFLCDNYHDYHDKLVYYCDITLSIIAQHYIMLVFTIEYYVVDYLIYQKERK